MSSPNDGGQPIGEALLASGWRQGALFSTSSIAFVWNTTAENSDAIATQESRRLRGGERFVVISQDCDIRESPEQEPFVEALICRRMRGPDFLGRVDRNSARWFVIDPANGLVAEAKYRVPIAKQMLIRLQPEPWPSDPKRFERFVRWLARRYDRPALPDALVEVFQNPVAAALEEVNIQTPDIGTAFSAAVQELRVNVPPTEAPPFDLEVVYLVRNLGLSDDEVNAIEYVDQAIRCYLDPAQVHLPPGPIILTEEEMSLAQYFATRPLFLEFLTYQGDEVLGTEPPPRR